MGLREIVLDTETTGLDPLDGHRIVEVAALELVNHVPTGRSLRFYLNPERDMPEEAERVHGLTAAFLADKPRFAEVAQELVEFLGDAKLVIHNAEFDMRFLNAELKALGMVLLAADRAVDTLAMAKQRFPGAPASLDALCRRFNIDNTARTLHGALLDCELLAEVYLELVGGRQPQLGLASQRSAPSDSGEQATAKTVAPRPARPHAPSAEELQAHAAMLAQLSDPIWARD